MATIMFDICDRHDAKGEQVEATQKGVPIRFGKADMEADLCQDCFDECEALIQPLIEFARRAGRAATPQRRTPPGARPERSTGDEASPSGYKREAPNSPDGKHVCRASLYMQDVLCERAVSTQQQPGFETSQARGVHEHRTHHFSMPQMKAKARAEGKPVEELQIRTQEEVAKRLALQPV